MSAPGLEFGFAFEERYRRAARPFGITPDTAWVRVTPDRLTARFGPWRVDTPTANVGGVSVTGPYRFWRTAGPARLAVTDCGLTFATTSRAGVLITFTEPVVGIDRVGVIRHPELTVTVADVEGLAALLATVA